MEAIARRTIDDTAVAEALMPGSAGVARNAARPVPQRDAVSIRGLTAGVAFRLADCCHPVPGDRIVGLRRPDAPVEVHTIDCSTLASGPEDADWVDLAWGDKSDGGTARLSVILRNEPGALGAMASILGAHAANILNLTLVHRDGSFHTFLVDLEVHDLAHLMRILAALRAADAISQAERVRLGDEERWEAA
jgi:(p)ppGpp synthase/HD superfamily hydrolase